MRQFPHSQSHLRVENVYAISLQNSPCYLLGKGLGTAALTSGQEPFCSFHSSTTSPGKNCNVLLTMPTFTLGFHSKE